MLRTCCVPDCKSNNRSARYKGTFTLLFPFPREDRRKAQWLLSIPKSDFQLYKGSAVCIKHFEDRFIIHEDKVARIDGSEVIVNANNIKLSDDAVPTLFNTRKLPSKNVTKRRRRESKMQNNEFEESLSTKQRGYDLTTKILDTEVLEKRNYITCCAQACTNTSKNHVLIRLPLDFERRQQWISRINRDDWTPSKYSALCQMHFEADVWEENAFGEKVLKDDFLPTLNLHGVTFDKSSKFKDELVRKISDDKTAEQERDNCICIKEESLEPDIEMLEETPSVIQPFETVYLYSNIGKHNDNLIENTNVKSEEVNKLQVETIVPDILPEGIKTEPLDIANIQSQTTSTLSCPECNQDFKLGWELHFHLREKHSGSESTLRLINEQGITSSKSTEVCDPAIQMACPSILEVTLTTSLTNVTSTTTCSSSTSTQVEGTQRSVSPLVSTCHSASTIILEGGENPISNKHLHHITQTKQPTFLSEAGSISAVPPFSTPTTFLPSSTVDSSAAFFISLTEFPESQRVEIKREMLEVVEMWKKRKFTIK